MSSMKKRIVVTAVTAAMGTLLSLPAAAGTSVDGRYGLLGWGEGFGLQLALPLSDNTALRFRLTDTDWDGDEQYSDVTYDLHYKLRTSGVIFDWRPGSGIFFLSGGLLYNHKHEFYGTATGNLTIGSFSGNATVRADVEWDRKTAPYIGLGWGNVGLQKHKGLAWSVELGIGFVGDLDVRLAQTGGSVTIPPGDLAAEQRDLEDDLDFMRRYPMISFGLGYSF
jgi:hypothetical protein